MNDTPEVSESPEKQVTKTPEKKIDTFDDLRTSDKSKRIDTFDDIRKQGADSSIKTFDDLRDAKETGDKTKITETTDKAVKETPKAIEQKRIDKASEEIRKIEEMNPEKWKTLNNDKKAYALRHAGGELGETFKNPDPPLMTKKWEEPGTLGSYGDGPSYDSKEKKWVGDYGIEMNEKGYNYDSREKLFGDNPKEALKTYAHEFRHSYQNEQAHAFDKGLNVDDPQKAKEWSDNLKDYKQPPDAELSKTDPEKYFKEYEAYRNQTVERDAREFGEKVSSKVYEQDTELKEK